MEDAKIISVAVTDEEEAVLIQAGLADQRLRAFLKIGAVLNKLENIEQKQTVIDAACIIMDIPMARKR